MYLGENLKELIGFLVWFQEIPVGHGIQKKRVESTKGANRRYYLPYSLINAVRVINME